MKDNNIEFTRGDTFVLQVSVPSEVRVSDNYELYLTVKEDYEKEDYIFQKTNDDNNIKYDETDNEFIITIDPEDTNELECKSYVYDIEYKKDNFVKTIAIGKLKLTKEVTFYSNEKGYIPPVEEGEKPNEEIEESSEEIIGGE